LEHADLSPEAASEVGKRLVELAAQAEEGQVVRVHIAVGGAVGFQGRLVVSELREEGEEQ
jgi:Fe-S cluster assembly iron-binding protein IscA